MTFFRFTMSDIYVDPHPTGGGGRHKYCFTKYCFTAVGVSITPITKGPPAHIFFGWHVFCSPGH